MANNSLMFGFATMPMPKRSRRRFHFVVPALLAVAVLSAEHSAAVQEDQQEQATALLSRAAELSNIRLRGGGPFVLQARVRMPELVAGPAVGSYVVVWSSPELWREEITIAGHKEIYIVNGRRVWGWSSSGYQPLRIYDLRQALDFGSRLRIRKEVIKEIRWRNENGTLMKCIEMTFRELCFDHLAGTLVRENPMLALTNQYTDYAPWESKLFPRTMRVFEGDTLVVEVKVDKLGAYLAPDPSWFTPPNGEQWALRIGGGGIVPPELIHQVLPEYTSQARWRGIEGEVYIEAIVTTQGAVAFPRLVRGLPDMELNRRAMESVLQWRFEPGLKDDQPVPIFALFTVTFQIHSRR